MAFRAADQQGQVAAAVAPVLQAFGQLFGRPCLAAPVQRDHVHRFRQCRDHPRAFVRGRAHGIAALAAQSGFDFDQLQWQPVRKALAVFGESIRHPGGRLLTDGDETRFHDAAYAAPAFSGGWSPTVHRRSSA